MNKNQLKLILIGVVSFVILVWGMASLRIINETERGIVKRGGKITSVAQPGFGLYAFPIYTLDKLSVQQDTNVFQGVIAHTKDQQRITVDVSVTLRIPKDDDSIKEFYRNFRNMNNFLHKILRRNITDSMQVALGKFSAIEIVQKREDFNNLYFDLVTESVNKQPIEILSVQIENITFSPEYIQRIEKRMEAEVEISTRQQNLETEKLNAEIKRTQAQAKADSLLIERQAEADAVLLMGKAEADAIKLKNEALNSSNSDSVIKVMEIDKWDGKLPVTILGEGVTPLMNLQ